jgi:hypothetical protein
LPSAPTRVPVFETLDGAEVEDLQALCLIDGALE